VRVHSKRDVDFQPAIERFFDYHLAGVKARLEAQTTRALERQQVAWRETLHREALLEEKDFDQEHLV
jgi:hypothetical protein